MMTIRDSLPDIIDIWSVLVFVAISVSVWAWLRQD